MHDLIEDFIELEEKLKDEKYDNLGEEFGDHYKLSNMTRNILLRNNIPTLEFLIKGLEDANGVAVRYIGEARIKEIEGVVGFPIDRNEYFMKKNIAGEETKYRVLKRAR